MLARIKTTSHLKGMTAEQLHAAFTAVVNTTSREHYDGNVYASDTDGYDLSVTDVTTTSRSVSFRFRLKVRDYDRGGWRYSASGRRIKSASWEAHRDILRALFAAFGDALTVTTAMATYKGPQGFEQNYPQTANVNVGSMIAPATMRDLTA